MCHANNKITLVSTTQRIHTHSWAGLALDNGILDHHLPLLCHHLIPPFIFRLFIFFSRVPSLFYRFGLTVIICVTSFINLSHPLFFPPCLLKKLNTLSCAVGDNVMVCLNSKIYPRPYFFFFIPILVPILLQFFSFLPAPFLPHHPIMGTTSMMQSCGLPSPLSPNPLKEKAWMGIQPLRHMDWARSANKEAKSLSLPSRIALPPHPAFILGDNCQGCQQWHPGCWRNVAHFFPL